MAEYSDNPHLETYHALLSYKLPRLRESDLAQIQQLQLSAVSNDVAEKLNAYREINRIIVNGEWEITDPYASVPDNNERAVDNYKNLYNEVSKLIAELHGNYATGKSPASVGDLEALNDATSRIENLPRLPEIKDGEPVVKAFRSIDYELSTLYYPVDDLYKQELEVHRNAQAREQKPPHEPDFPPVNPTGTPGTGGQPAPYPEPYSGATADRWAEPARNSAFPYDGPLTGSPTGRPVAGESPPPSASYYSTPVNPHEPEPAAPPPTPVPAAPEPAPAPITIKDIGLEKRHARLEKAVQEKLPRISAEKLQEIRIELETNSKSTEPLSPQERHENVLNALQKADKAILDAETTRTRFLGKDEAHDRNLHGKKIQGLRKALWAEIETLHKEEGIRKEVFHAPETVLALLPKNNSKKAQKWSDTPETAAKIVYGAYEWIGKALSPIPLTPPTPAPTPPAPDAPTPAPAPQAPKGQQTVAGETPPSPDNPGGPNPPPQPPGNSPNGPNTPGQGDDNNPPTPPGGNGPDAPGRGGGDDGKTPPSAGGSEPDKEDDGKNKSKKTIFAVVGAVAAIAIAALIGKKALGGKDEKPQQAMGRGM